MFLPISRLTYPPFRIATPAMSEQPPSTNEAREQEHLDRVRDRIRGELHDSTERLQAQYNEMREAKQYLQAGKGSMDHVEKLTVRQSIDQLSRAGEHRSSRQLALSRLYQSPYFGRVDFQRADDGDARPLYVGMHAFQGDDPEHPLVFDWRAPVSGMFYDHEPGPAAYESPEGTVRGHIERKRQYRIEKGELKFMFDTGLHIQDEVLQEELSRASDDKMRNIVSTIQRDQNAVIRNEHAHSLVLQGAAGSGKTSIALHRIAYLLYTHRDEMDSSEILILSPNKVFAHYISDVLPELGEEMIKETTIEVLADHLLNFNVKFESFADQVAKLAEGDDPGLLARVRYKGTLDFVAKLEEYASQVRAANLSVREVTISFPTREHVVPAKVVADGFARNDKLAFNARVTAVVGCVEDHLRRELGRELTPKQRTDIRGQISGMVRRTNVQSLYREFFLWAAEPALFQTGPKSTWEYADVFPLIYLGMLLEGCTPFRDIKHLVIDEMQDYSPVQYKVLGRLFPCRKTVLGDIQQSVNPHGSSTAEMIRDVLPRSEAVSMYKTYRSSVEIMRFALGIHPNPKLEPLERHGPPPRVVGCDNLREELEAVKAEVRDFLASDHQTMGVVCRTGNQAETFAMGLREFGEQVHLLEPESTRFHAGVVVTNAHLAKGLEFDRVVVPFCGEHNYRGRNRPPPAVCRLHPGHAPAHRHPHRRAQPPASRELKNFIPEFAR